MSLCLQMFRWEMLPGEASRDRGSGIRQERSQVGVQCGAWSKVPQREGSHLAQLHRELWGQCGSHLRVSLSRARQLENVHLCTPQSQVKGFPRRPKLLSTPGAPVVGTVNSGSLRAVVPQNGIGAGSWSEGTRRWCSHS